MSQPFGNIPTQPFGYSGVARETIYSALATQLKAAMGLTVVYRARVNIASLNANTSPVGILMQATGRRQLPVLRGPHRQVDTAVFCVGIAQQSVDPNYVASTQLNIYRDLLDFALTNDQPDMRHTTLGGIVDYCCPIHDMYAETLQNDIWTSFTTTLEFLYTPINFV